MNTQINPVNVRGASGGIETNNPSGEGGRSFRKPALILAAAIAIAGGAGLIWRHWNVAGTGADFLVVSGNIEAHQSLVSFKDVQSRIVELPFEEGQWVEQGALLARLDDSNYRQQVAVDEAAERAQEEQLASARANLEAAQHTVANDRADMEQRRADHQRYDELWKAGAT